MSNDSDNKPERKKLSLHGPVPVEVKQSFSNRRSKTVKVEHKIMRGGRKMEIKSQLSPDELSRRAEALQKAKENVYEPNAPSRIGQKVFPREMAETAARARADTPAPDSGTKETPKKQLYRGQAE